MPIVRVFSASISESPVPRKDEVFVSLESTPNVLAQIRAALPQLRKELAARWPISRVEMENRMSALRRNPYDPKQAVEAVLGIRVVFLLARTAEVFFGEVVKEVGKGVGQEISEYVRESIQRVRQKHPPERKASLLPGPGRAGKQSARKAKRRHR